MSDKRYTHVSIGNLNIDIAVYLERLPAPGETLYAFNIDVRPGGAATNYAATVAQYGHNVYLVASVSSNEYVKMILGNLERLGVNVSRVKVVDEPPGAVVVFVQPGGERSMVKYPGANRELLSSDVSRELIQEAHVVHMASISPELAGSTSKICAKEGIYTTYDPGVYAEALGKNAFSIIENIDVLFVNEREFKCILKYVKVDSLFKYGLSMLVIKMGQRGAVLALPSGTCYHGLAQPIKRPVDTTGAGDAFDALFNAKYIESKDPSLALAYGVAAGALKTGFRGSFLYLDSKLLDLQLKRVVVEKSTKCQMEFS